MTVRKVTISVDELLLKNVDELATKAGLSRSEWLADAAERSIQLDKLRGIVGRALKRAGGPATGAERAAARRDLGLPGGHARHDR